MWTVCKMFFKHFEKHSKNVILIVLLKTFLLCFFCDICTTSKCKDYNIFTTFLKCFCYIISITFKKCCENVSLLPSKRCYDIIKTFHVDCLLDLF